MKWREKRGWVARFGGGGGGGGEKKHSIHILTFVLDDMSACVCVYNRPHSPCLFTLHLLLLSQSIGPFKNLSRPTMARPPSIIIFNLTDIKITLVALRLFLFVDSFICMFVVAFQFVQVNWEVGCRWSAGSLSPPPVHYCVPSVSLRFKSQQ